MLTGRGFHVPVIPLVEVVGNVGGVEPKQTSATAVNVGLITLIFICKVVTIVH